MEHAVKVDHYVRLKTLKELDKKDVKNWFNAVRDAAPEGTLSSVPLVQEGHGPKQVQLIHNTFKEGSHTYDIPLTRDLTEREIAEIVELFSSYYENGNFLVEGSSETVMPEEDVEYSSLELSEDAYERLCQKLAKTQHQRWYEEKVDQGWRYGLKESKKDKTHPMLRPWQELPDDYKTIDRELPQIFMNVMAEEGWVVVNEDELNKLIEDLD